MRKLAIAVGVSVAMLIAGGVAWNADATTWRSGTLNLPGATKNYSPIEQIGCYGWGKCPSNGAAVRIGARAGPADAICEAADCIRRPLFAR